MMKDADIAEGQEDAAFFLAPRRRGKLVAVIASVALFAVVTFIYFTMQGPNSRSVALEMTEQTVSAFSGQTLGPPDLKRHAKRLGEALSLAPQEEAIKAAVEKLKGQLHAQLVSALAFDKLDDAEALLNEATVIWPEEEAFKGYGDLAMHLKQRRRALELREELLTKLSEAQARLEGGPATLEAIRHTLGLVEELLDQDSVLKTDAEINSNLRELLSAGARAAANEDEIRGASQLLDASRDLWRDDVGLRTLDQHLKSKLGELDRTIEIGQLVNLGHERLSKNLLTTPAGASARDAFDAVLMMEPDHAQALDGMQRIADRYVELIGAALGANDLSKARQLLNSLETFDAGQIAIQPLKERLSDKERLLELERLNAERSASAAEHKQGDVPVTAQTPTSDAVPADHEGTLWLQVRDFCATLDQYIIAYPAGRYVEEAWLRKSDCLKQ